MAKSLVHSIRSSNPSNSVRAYARGIIVTLTACLMAGCSSGGGGDWGVLYDAVKAEWSGSGTSVRRADAAAIPYATIGVRIGDGPEGILILVADTARKRLWASSAHVAITTRDGRIIRTAGTPHDIAGYTMLDPAASPDWTKPTTWRWQGDFPDLNAYSILVTCHDRPVDRETVTILGAGIRTLRVDETCSAPDIGWVFTNMYWVSPTDGTVWQSVQHVHPDMDAIEIRLLRPPA